MRIAVWRTGHEIADAVALAVHQSLREQNNCWVNLTDDLHDKMHLGDMIIKEYIDIADIHVGYGILRGMDDVFRACQKAKKPFFLIDRGYWKPGHYDGYYRISLNGTQQTTGLDKLKPDYERWDRLGLDILPARTFGSWDLICPPTDYVADYFGIDYDDWIREYVLLSKQEGRFCNLRTKDCKFPLDEHLNASSSILTFNSSVGWEALRQGIPVVSDPTHSIVGAYAKLIDKPLHTDYEERRKLFALMAGMQLQLSEVRSGKLWPLLQQFLTIN